MSALLDKVIELAAYHADRKKEMVETWFTRMLHERIKGHRLKAPSTDLPRVQLTDEAVEVVATHRPLSELSKFDRWHKEESVDGPGEPLILFEGFGQPCHLIDGTSRINKWVSEGDQGPHPVLIVKRRE